MGEDPVLLVSAGVDNAGCEEMVALNVVTGPDATVEVCTGTSDGMVDRLLLEADGSLSLDRGTLTGTWLELSPENVTTNTDAGLDVIF